MINNKNYLNSEIEKKILTTESILAQQQRLLEQQNQQLLQQQAQLAELEQKRIEQIEFQKLLEMQKAKGNLKQYKHSPRSKFWFILP